MPELAPPEATTAGCGEFLLDLLAAGAARVAAFDQPGSRPEDEPLHLGHLTAERLSHVGVGKAAQFREDERGALVLRKLLEICHELAQVGAPLHLIVEPFGAWAQGLFRLLAARPEHRQAAVAGDRVEPRPEPDLAVVAQKVPMCGCESVLNGVLALVARPEHVSAEREDARHVALVNDLECRLVPAAELLDQLVIAAHRKEPLRSPRDCAAVGRDTDGARHGLIVLPRPPNAKQDRPCNVP